MSIIVVECRKDYARAQIGLAVTGYASGVLADRSLALGTPLLERSRLRQAEKC